MSHVFLIEYMSPTGIIIGSVYVTCISYRVHVPYGYNYR